MAEQGDRRRVAVGRTWLAVAAALLLLLAVWGALRLSGPTIRACRRPATAP